MNLYKDQGFTKKDTKISGKKRDAHSVVDELKDRGGQTPSSLDKEN
jgi:hypothetical protein